MATDGDFHMATDNPHDERVCGVRFLGGRIH